jgi:hypothetical protein
MRALFSAFILMLVAETALAASCETVNYRCEASLSSAVSRAGRATVMVRIPGHNQCTGTLVNNVRGDGRPYILLARHCAANATDSQLPNLAQTMEISYRYESSCGDTQPLDPIVTVGATHRAAYRDAWLVEANTAPPAEAEAYMAGVYLSSGTRRAFGVHHGNGQPKQFVEQQIVSGNIVYLVLGLLGETLQTWKTDLLRGSTPHGASGSALFDESVRVVGLLSGGNSCAGDRRGNDYQQLAEVWNGGGSAAKGLKAWLDPDRVGVQGIAGTSAKGLTNNTPRPPSVIEGDLPAANESGGGGGSFGLLGLLSLLLIAAARPLLGRRNR